MIVGFDDVTVDRLPEPTCDGLPVPVSFEGLHVFDISDLSNPRLLAAVNMRATSTPVGCGSGLQVVQEGDRDHGC